MTIVHSLQSAGPYHLAERLGFNGVVATYKAFENETNLQACVVVIEQAAIQNANAFSRFSTEFSALVTAPVSRVCQPMHFGTEAGVHWAAFESVRGRHLGNLVREQGLPSPGRSIDMMAQCVEALTVMHRNGVAHRLVTPASILINDIEKVKLMHAAWGGLLLGVASGPANPAFLSNLPFLSPEVAFGGEGDESSDVYSLGANLYFLLTGRPTHWASDPQALLNQIQTEAVDLSPLQDVVPGEVIQVVEEMLQPDPDDRPVNLEALFGRLDSLAAWLLSGEQFVPEQPSDALRLSAGDVYARTTSEESPTDQLTTVEIEMEQAPPEPAGQSGASVAERTEDSGLSLAASRPGSPNQAIEAQRKEAEKSGTKFPSLSTPPTDFGEGAAGQFGTGIAPARPQAEYLAVLEEEQESPSDRKNRVLLMAVSGGLVLLALFIWAVITVISVLNRPATPKQPPRQEGLQAQYQAELAASQNYQVSIMKLKKAGDFNRKYIAQNGVWASSTDDLIAVGAEMPAVTDAWGKEFDVRDEFIVCAGEDGKWDNQDDFWYDCKTELIGGYQPKFDLPETSPVLGDVNRQLNEVMNRAMDQQMMMREAIAEQERMATGNWSRGTRQDRRSNDNWASQPFDPRYHTEDGGESGGEQ